MNNREFYELYDLDYNKADDWDGGNTLVLHDCSLILSM